MLREQPIKAKESMFLVAKIKDYSQLLKPNLSFMVVFSSVIGYLLAPGIVFEWDKVLLLFIGGTLVTGGANTINQILEREGDAMMKRTMIRPLPDQRMGLTEAWIIAIAAGLSGVLLLGLYFNALTGILSLISLLLYAFAYTPMKRVHPIAVLIGAIPGAMPPLLGWAAATNGLSAGGWILFTLQFFWQFPHYWAIAWVGYDEYKKAGISMLPSQERTSKFTALQCMFYSIVLIPAAVMPRMIGVSGNIGMWVSMACGFMYFVASFAFYLKNDYPSAKRVMFSSFIYLPVVLLSLLFDKL
ncbi:MAG: protoheme IX farnesyltransferase [Bacteroidetes bacterium 43-93]|nr:heme o synthase [Bacteroidota bacterium]OJW98134.1 MAG: protoheme IX farnesyltransferase [Bacteroidetes bacterium 43-93]